MIVNFFSTDYITHFPIDDSMEACIRVISNSVAVLSFRQNGEECDAPSNLVVKDAIDGVVLTPLNTKEYALVWFSDYSIYVDDLLKIKLLHNRSLSVHQI